MPIIGVIASSINMGGGNWIMRLTDSVPSASFPNSVLLDSSGATYIVWSQRIQSSPLINRPVLTKVKADGTEDWSRTYAIGTPGSTTFFGALGGGGTDSSNNIYWAGYNNSSDFYVYLFKHNSSGTEQYAKIFNGGNSSNAIGRAMTANPNGSGQFIVYTTNPQNPVGPSLARFDNAGNLGTIRAEDTPSQGYGCTMLPDQSMLATVYRQAFFNPSSTLVWTASPSSNIIDGSCSNPNGDLFSIGTNGSVGKNNTANLNMAWARQVQTGSSAAWGIGANNSFVYSVHRATVSSIGAMVIQKRAVSDGTLQWQRIVRLSGVDIGGGQTNSNLQTIVVNSTDKDYWLLMHEWSNPGNFYLLKLPADGTKTGNYTVGGVTVIYENGLYTDVAYTATRTSSGTGQGSPTITASNTAVTSSATSIADTKVTV